MFCNQIKLDLLKKQKLPTKSYLRVMYFYIFFDDFISHDNKFTVFFYILNRKFNLTKKKICLFQRLLLNTSLK